MQTNRMVMMVIMLVVVIALAATGIIALVAHAGGSTSQDSALQSTLQTVKRDLDKPGKLPVSQPTLQSFQAWVYNTRASFLASVRHESASQFAQVVLNDPNTMPPQTIGLNQANHPVNGLPTSAIIQAFKSTDPQCGDTTSALGQKLRFCTIALNTPGALQSSSATGLLTVLTPKA